ncbi:MAG: hypothetical protein KJ066_13570 [Acidobacteria bacterium]|nr:hypothetical protein [Acidobacteriota bacterium]
MGKRELLLILAFAALGVLTYRVTAPPSNANEEGFSLSRLVRHAMADLRGQNATAEVAKSATVAVPADVTHLAVRGFSGRLTIVGEDRPDVAVDLSGTIFGFDEAEAKARADTLQVDVEVEGDAVVLDLELPEGRRRPRIEVEVALPRRLAVQVEAEGGRLEVRNVAGVSLDSRRVETTLVDVAGPVTGEQRDGALEIAGAGSVDFTSRRTAIRLERISGPIAGEYTDGRLLVREAAGPLTVETRRVSVELESVAGDTKIVSTDGRLVLRNQRGALQFEGERAPLTATFGAAVAVEARSQDGTIEVTLAPGEGATLDLEADEGTIRLPQDETAPTREGRVERVRTEIGGGGPAVRVRTTRANIVVRR